MNLHCQCPLVASSGLQWLRPKQAALARQADKPVRIIHSMGNTGSKLLNGNEIIHAQEAPSRDGGPEQHAEPIETGFFIAGDRAVEIQGAIE